MASAEYTRDYMVEHLIKWTPYCERWLDSLPFGQLRAMFRRKQQEILYSITKDPVNKPKELKSVCSSIQDEQNVQLTLGI